MPTTEVDVSVIGVVCVGTAEVRVVVDLLEDVEERAGTPGDRTSGRARSRWTGDVEMCRWPLHGECAFSSVARRTTTVQGTRPIHRSAPMQFPGGSARSFSTSR
jgi:hypothetical protein